MKNFEDSVKLTRETILQDLLNETIEENCFCDPHDFSGALPFIMVQQNYCYFYQNAFLLRTYSHCNALGFGPTCFLATDWWPATKRRVCCFEVFLTLLEFGAYSSTANILYPAVKYASAQHQGRLFWITCKRLKLLRKASCLQLIQNIATPVVQWRQFDIRIFQPSRSKITQPMPGKYHTINK